MAGERQFAIVQSRALRDKQLGPAAKLVLTALGDFTNVDGVCWPSVETLALRSSLSRRTVFRALDALVDRGWLRRVRRGPKTTLYQVVQDRPIEELKAEYSDVETLDDAAGELVTGAEMMCHGGTSFGEGEERGATTSPLEVPPWHTEGRAVKGELPSSSASGPSTRDDNADAEAEDAGSEASGQIPESRGRGKARPPDETPAALRAPTSAPPLPAADDPDLHVGLASRFTDRDQRAAYLGYRRGHRFPMAYDAELRTLNEPMTGGQPVPWDVIGRQLLQLQGNGEAFNARLLAGYCRSAMADRERPTPRKSSRGQDKSTTTRSEFLQLVGQPEERAS